MVRGTTSDGTVIKTPPSPSGLVPAMLVPASVEIKSHNTPTAGHSGEPVALPNVTFLTSFLPYPIDQGGIMATAGFIEALAKSASTSVLVLTSTSYASDRIRVAEKFYSQFCRSFVVKRFDSLSPTESLPRKAWHYLTGYPRHGFWSEEAEQALIAHLQSTGCDVVWCNSPYESKYLPTVKRMGRKTVLTTHNVETNLVRQQARTVSGISRWNAWVKLLDMNRLEKQAVESADVVTAISEVDLQHFRRMKSVERTFLLPFGYRTANGLTVAAAEATKGNAVCFVGAMEWAPNVTAAKFLVQEIMPLVWKTIPDTKCFLVGKNPGKDVAALKSDKVIVTGSVPSIADYYRSTPITAVPMREGSGVKIKLVEAMALGCAVVTTSLGAAGISVQNGRQVIIADTVDDFANAIIKLLPDRPERIRLGTEAQAFVRQSLSPKQTEDQVQRILECLQQH